MRPNNLGQVSSGITWSGAEIEDVATDRDSGLLPATERDRSPDAMLKTEAAQFFFIGAKDVIAFRCHNSIFRLILYAGKFCSARVL
jgi:hypothetical protein